MTPNPFTPAFGVSPAVLAGRRDVTELMAQAFDQGLGNPHLNSVFTGARGSGKTALLTEIQRIGGARGWIAASTSALPGMLTDLLDQARLNAAHLVNTQSDKQLTSVSAGPLSLSWDNTDVSSGHWRTEMTLLLDQLAETNTGLLFMVDEVDASLPEMATLAASYQHFVTEGRQVALMLAGLPYQIDNLLSSKSISFLRRARRHDIGRITDLDVKNSFTQTIEQAGGTITHEALTAATQAIDGFAFMLQLVGYESWNHAINATITIDDAKAGIAQARELMENQVLATTFNELSKGDEAFLRAMLADTGPSRLVDIAERLNKGTNYASTYRTRLMRQGIIGMRGRGKVGFELPGFREYLAKLPEDEE